MKSYTMTKKECKPSWILIDGSGKVLGKTASTIAGILRGKTSTQFTPHIPSSIRVIVTNVDKLILTGDKKNQKVYYKHTGYMGGLKEISYRNAVEKDPSFPLYQAVLRMLQKCPLRAKVMKNLFIYTGSTHVHTAQNPVEMKI